MQFDNQERKPIFYVILFGMLIFFIVNVISGYNISTMVSGKLDIAKDNISAIEIGDKILKITSQSSLYIS